MSNKNNQGIGFGGLLTVLFIGLKLTGNIDWSWWWVLSPLWIGASIVVFLLFVILTLFIVGKGAGYSYRYRLRK